MRPISILAVVLLLAVAVAGQTNKGGISGTVMDQNGAAIPGATVTVINVGTGQKQTVTTSEDGAFQVQSLDPVTYSITVEAQGFKTSKVESLKVDTAATASANILMEPGAVGEQVTVVADAPLLNTESGTASSTVTERQIQEIPLANRSVLDLAVTAPNVSGDAGSEDPDVTSGQPVPGYNLSVGGGRPGSTAILADGVNNTGVGIARSVVSFTPETVQEFTVQTSAYSAEYGQTGGGVINVTTKSGTNDFNGVALLYHRNPKTNARPWRTGTGPRPPNNLRYTQLSLSAGGPVYIPKLYDGRNKTFFFFAYEPRWRRDFVTATTLLPTAAQRAGDFRDLVRTQSGFVPTAVAQQFNLTSIGPSNIYQQFIIGPQGQFLPITLSTGNQFCQFGDTRRTIVNNTYTINGVQTVLPTPQCTTAVNAAPIAGLNVIPQAFLDPTAQKILEFLPQASGYFLDESGLVRNAAIQRFVVQDETRYTTRIDHNFTDSFKTNFRYTVTPAIGIRGFGSEVNGNSAAYSDAKQALLTFNNIISPTMVNDLRLNYTRGVFSEDFSPEFSINGGRSLSTELGLPSLTEGGLPLFSYSADNGGNAFSDIGSSGSTNNFNVEQRFNISDILYWNRGNMTWKFGTDLSHARLNVVPFFAASGGRWNFRSLNTSSNRSTTLANGGNPFASLLIGVPNNVDVRPLLLNYEYRWNSGALFVQNDWKVRPNLTLNLGLRYSLQYPRYEKNNLQGVFRTDLGTTQTLTEVQRRAIATGLGLATTAAIPGFVPTTVNIPAFAFSGQGGRSRYITPVDYWGFEPRFGFAWSPQMFTWLRERSAVIRGGYGISHVPLTGNNRSPNPDFGSFTQVSTLAAGSSGAQNTGQPVRLSGNLPVYSGNSLQNLLGVSSDGIVLNNSVAIPAFADTGFQGGGGKVPYVQNWNLSLQFEPFRNTSIELTYTGNKGTHLYLPLVNINPRDQDVVEFLAGQNLSTETTFADPLGRRNLLGAVIAIPRGTVGTPFFGFSTLNRYFDPSGNSIRHAGYIDVRRRVRGGLTFTANYTFGKSIDDASDASPDTRVLSSGSAGGGQASYGAPRFLDRSVSTFDIKHNFSSTFVWDLPVGRKKWLLSEAGSFVNTFIGNWTMSGVFRLQGGQPLIPVLIDSNQLGGSNRVVRPNIVEGVSLKNPLWDRNCPVGALCEPYINPAAFMRPPKGSLGSAPRTLDVRGPMQRYFDLSFQKNFSWPFLRDEKRRINFRVDLINALNSPNFRLNTAGFTNLPSEVNLTQTEFNNWLAANPGRTETLAQVNALLQNNRLATGALPLNFFSVPVPEGFATRTPESFDITTLQGLKLYRLRQQFFTAADQFGTLRELQQPRYVQFGIRIFF
ncbi:MAG TPA: carboxypeptidase regulatory-like domain-containing protein [Pyrinomonadaceae bacterium]|nr:carboxypeptidase regulatory-like domain-containing protein [Pyrinomonadaceae bacterium]